jgi:urease accessory protein
MLDSPLINHQRSVGEARVSLDLRGGQTRLVGLRQSGSGKAILPRVEDGVPEVVFLNTSGGLTGGDTLSYALDVGAGCQAVGTTQTAERAYCSDTGVAEVSVKITAGAQGRVDWLPQETILFDGAQVNRRTRIELGVGARCLYAETVVLGRAAMGETLGRVMFRDDRMILREGRPVLAEPLVLDDWFLAGAGRGALLGGNRAFATVALVMQGAEDAAEGLRGMLVEPGVTAAVSGFDGKCVVRLLAVDGWPLRRVMMRILGRASGRALPRVWQI